MTTIYLPNGDMKFVFSPDDFKELLREHLSPDAEEYFNEFEEEQDDRYTDKEAELELMDEKFHKVRKELMGIWSKIDEMQKLIPKQNDTTQEIEKLVERQTATTEEMNELLKNLTDRVNGLI